MRRSHDTLTPLPSAPTPNSSAGSTCAWPTTAPGVPRAFSGPSCSTPPAASAPSPPPAQPCAAPLRTRPSATPCWPPSPGCTDCSAGPTAPCGGPAALPATPPPAAGHRPAPGPLPRPAAARREGGLPQQGQGRHQPLPIACAVRARTHSGGNCLRRAASRGPLVDDGASDRVCEGVAAAKHNAKQAGIGGAAAE
jgi:hypothetical protein